MTDLHSEIRTTLARLELVASASAAVLDASPGRVSEHPGGKRPPGSGVTADQWYRDRLNDLDAGHPRRVTDKHGRKQRDTYERLLEDARAELALLTGRDGKAPGVHAARVDTEEGFKEAVLEEAALGRPADDTATRLNGSVFNVRRIYLQNGYEYDGSRPAGDDDRERAEAKRMAGEGMTQTQIAMKLRKDQSTVSRWLRKAA